MTIPSLGLSPAVIAVRMDRMLSRELFLEIQDSVFWTDSMIVFQYIHSYSKRFQTFVKNRLSVIYDGSMLRQWRKVGAKDNPADDVSRGLSGFEMISNNHWKRGPEFPWQDKSAWPTTTAATEVACEDEEVKNQVKCCVSSVQDDARDKGRHSIPRVDNEQESKDPMVRFIVSYSCWHRVETSVALLLRYRD